MDCCGVALRSILKAIQLHQDSFQCPLARFCPPDFRTALFSTPARKRRKNPRTVTMPDHVGPHVKLVFAEMARQRMT
jgi:hypothetical protein